MSRVRMMHEPAFNSLSEQQEEGDNKIVRKYDYGFRELNKILTKSAASRKDALLAITELAARAMDVNRVGIWSYDKQNEEILCEDQFILSENRHEEGMKISEVNYPKYFAAVKSHKFIAADDAINDEYTKEFNNYLIQNDIVSMLDFRITVGQELGGIICFENTGSKREWSFSEQMFANAVGDTVSLIWEGYERDRQNELLSKRNQELKMINQELDQFVYSLSHDIRAPLTSIMALINLIKTEQNTGDIKSYLDLQELSVKRLDQFIISTSNMLKNRDRGVHLELLRINPMINKILQLIEYVPNREKININLDTRQNGTFYTDKSKLTVIIQNLILNSIEYHDYKKDNAYLNISADIDDNFCKISFEDNGHGIKPAKLGHIVNIFSSGRNFTRPVALGLSIVKDQLDQLSGKISFSSTLGIGTTITVTLPNMYDQI